MNNVGIGVLFYNELKNAQKIYEDIIASNIKEIDFYFLDNGSQDIEFKLWLSTIDENIVKLITSEKNLGFGGGAKLLLRSMPNSIVGYMPGNYKVRPCDLWNLQEALGDLSSFEFYKAIRSGRSYVDQFKTFLVGLATSLAFKSRLFDSGGTPTLISSKNVDLFMRGPDDFSFEAFGLYVARQKKMRVRRSRIKYGSRLFGKSHWQSGLGAEVSLLMRIMKSKNEWKKLLG